MSDEVRQRGARFVLVSLSNAIQAYPDRVVRQNFMKHIGTNAVFYPNVRLKISRNANKLIFWIWLSRCSFLPIKTESSCTDLAGTLGMDTGMRMDIAWLRN
jgi:hypothetical protein